MPIETKSGQTLNRDFFRALKNWLPLVGKEAVFPSLVYGGSDRLVQNGVRLFGCKDVPEVLSFESGVQKLSTGSNCGLGMEVTIMCVLIGALGYITPNAYAQDGVGGE